jgi:hypothetical protein
MKTVNGIPVIEETDPISVVPGYTQQMANQVIPSLEIKVIGQNQNLNNYRTTGVYHQRLTAYASSALNYPTTSAGLLEVTEFLNFSYQRYTSYPSATGCRVYVRGRYNSTWSAWRQIG